MKGIDTATDTLVNVNIVPPVTPPVSVPEFPSMTVPITAILGLLVVFGRKKE